MNKENLPSSIYIHIPFCKSKCIYCGFFSEPPSLHDIKKVLSAELAELKNSVFNTPVKTIYIGGGSPASIPPSVLCSFLSEVTKITGTAEEFTIEINPANADEKLFENLKSIGTNRISIGAQSFNQAELDFLGRKYQVKKIADSIQMAKSVGFKNISIDLIFAVPGFSLDSWKKNLDRAIGLDVQHISAYSLTYEMHTPLEKMKSSGKIKIVSEENDRQMYEETIKILNGSGFVHYEISNFAKPGYECVHNLAYWKNEYYIGIGPSASSYFENYRIENVRDINKYLHRIEQSQTPANEKTSLTKLQTAANTAVLALRRLLGIDLAEYKTKIGFDIYDLFADEIASNLQSGFLQLTDGRLHLTSKALPIADSVLCDFTCPE